MKIGIPKEIKNNENRVALTPSAVAVLVKAGHDVIIQEGAGRGASFEDNLYVKAGAKIESDVAKIWQSEMVMKVKEPLSEEYQYFRKDLILFTYLHLAPVPELTSELVKSGVTAIGYETIQEEDRSLPLLTPMSEVAGRMSIQIGAQFLEKNNGGSGVLLSGVPGVQKGKVVVIGGGVAGTNAARIALGMGADVTILDISAKQLAAIDNQFNGHVATIISNSVHIAQAVKDADLVIGAVLIAGARAPKLVSREMIASMKKGSVVVDIAIDQGGIFETSDHVTTHDNPVYTVDGVLHYAVANMPGAVPNTSTQSLSNVTLPYALKIAQGNLVATLAENEAIRKGVNVYQGHIVNAAVAKAQKLDYVPVEDLY